MPEARKLLSILVEPDVISALLTAGTGIFDATLNDAPHRFDDVTPAIENHFGNVPPSMYFMTVWMMFYKQRIRNVIGERIGQDWANRADLAAPVVGVAMVGMLNMMTEAIKPNNYEFAGDVTAGITAAVAISLIYLANTVFRNRGRRRSP